jgi:hypothetical protein
MFKILPMMLSVRVMETEKWSEVMPRESSCLRRGKESRPISNRWLKHDRPKNVTGIT